MIGISTVRLILSTSNSGLIRNSPNTRMLTVASDVIATTSNELRMFDHQHRPGLDAVDDHGSHQHRRRRRPWYAERESWNDMAGDRGHVAGLGGHQAVDRPLAELLPLLADSLGRR